jgi:DNA-nicking Smr family endonuclease
MKSTCVDSRPRHPGSAGGLAVRTVDSSVARRGRSYQPDPRVRSLGMTIRSHVVEAPRSLWGFPPLLRRLQSLRDWQKRAEVANVCTASVRNATVHPTRSVRKRKPPPSDQRSSREAWGRVHPLLDLHGLTGDQARRRAEQWMRDRQAEGVRTVVLVTGRGLHSQGIPVVRNEVQHVLEELKGTLVVRWHSTHFGGSFQVELRKPPQEPPRRVEREPALLREAPPDVALRAAEALAELGIASTPALLEAEIRRILREEGGE